MSGTQASLRPLSNDARVAAGCFFGLMAAKDMQLTFGMRKSRPTLRLQAALDELVAAKVLSVVPFNSYGGVVYRALVDCASHGKWLMSGAGKKAAKGFELTEVVGS